MTINQNSFVAGEMFSRKQMYQMGLPIGNPHLPPFNRKEMPFFIAPAVTAASVAIGAAAAAGTAAAIGTAALATVGAIGTIAAVAGTAMSVVGMVTGDKSLMKIGAIVGLAGGVASLASGAVASLAAGGEFAMGTAGIQSANAANAAANAAATTSTTIANTMAGAVPQTMQQGAGGMLAKTGEVVAGQAGNTANLAGQQVGQTLAQTASDKIGIVGGITDATGKTLAQTASAGTVGAGNAGSGFFSKLMADMTPKDWIIAGGTAVATGAKAVSANQANATAQQKYEYERALKKQQIANLNDVPTLSNGTLANSGLLNVKKDLSVAV